jgi:DNA-binding transcriptional MerR regulator
MNRGIGATTIGAVLLAGMMLQPRGPVNTRDSGSNKAPEAEPAKAKASDGPWQASCNYWAAVVSAAQNGASSPDVTIAEKDGVKLQLKSGEEQAGCASDTWGLPSNVVGSPEISTIIATVPDPIHSHLALDFDRAIDAILLAAADNHYLSSYYWLPWRSQISTSSSGDTTANATKSTGADVARERLPGLIILRYAPDVSEWADAKTNDSKRIAYQRVIYLFLVGETPSLGINGNQLQNAFSYEKQLKNNVSVKSTLSVCWPRDAGRDCKDAENRLSIIGPIYSGSAASLHAGIEAALPNLGNPKVSITGVTATEIAVRELDSGDEVQYRSFGENVTFEQNQFLCSLAQTGYHLNRVAVLSEAGTVFGGGTDARSALRGCNLAPDQTEERILSLRFPRELSLLRNAEANQSSKPDASAPPTPYLNLSLKDYAADDTVPRFSTNQSPLSIEAQLMAIAHQLQRARSQFIVISASNVLDDIFLAEFLHRACPDSRLVILSGGDLLFERDVEDESYIGSISISPYLLSSLDFGNRTQWLHADFQAEEIYNAASFTFWNNGSKDPPTLAGYRSYPVADPHRDSKTAPVVQFQQIPMWAAVIGADGYYPLAILNWCGSNFPAILPTITRDGESLVTGPCEPEQATKRASDSPQPQRVWDYVPESINENSGISPSLPWSILTGFLLLACVSHTAFLWAADLWSPFTRDLAIDQNDLPHRRAVYLNIGTSVLLAMVFVTVFPLILVGRFFPVATAGSVLAWVTLLAAGATGGFTFLKTWRYCHHQRQPMYTFFNLLAGVALTVSILFWMGICSSGNLGGNHSYAGLYFSYRCLRPLSGVCPLVPILLLLLAWYLWAIYQTARLRFSDIHRPRLARLFNAQEQKRQVESNSAAQAELYQPSRTAYSLFVPDDVLDSCSHSGDNCLFENIMCLLITRQMLCRLCTKLRRDRSVAVRRFAGWVQTHLDRCLLGVYLVLFGFCLFAIPIHSIERFLFAPFFAGSPTRYECLIMALFFPLIMVALSGWLRVILIWGAMSRGLLEPLERMPIRFAFTRFKGGSWMSMLRQKGLHIRWRDMGRSTESIRQLVHHPELKKKPALHQRLLEEYEVLNARIHQLMKHIKAAGAGTPSPHATTTPANPELTAALQRADLNQEPCPSPLLWDIPKASPDLCSIYHIEQSYSEFCRLLLDGFLIPYWDLKRTGQVEDLIVPDKESDKPKDSTTGEPSFLHLAEELIVVRYVALIRAVLINIRYLMLFVSMAFVLALIAWNSYPFQPHAFIDWCFTILLGILTLGFVWVFAQMHRNAILSRITDTTANELGWEFYVRIAAFGAVPVLTWLAYQFPQIGGSLYRIIQPGLQVVK